jgi:type I restriction enzyme S subunit
MNNWKRQNVPLGQLCKPIERPETPVPGKDYRQIGVRLWGEGAYEREILEGSQTRYRSLNRVAEGDIIVNKIWARNGSVAVVPKDLEDCYCSSEFPLFSPTEDKMDARWFHWITKTIWFWNECGIASQGTSGKNRIRPKRFLEISIPLPPLSEQRHIISKLEQLASRTEDAKAIINELEQESKAFILSCVNKISSAASYGTIQEISPLIRRRIDIEPSRDYPELGIRSFGKGTFHKPAIKGSELGSKRIFSIEPGDLIFSNVFAWEGAIAVAQQNDIGRYGSHRFITCVPDPARAKAEFLCNYFLTDEGIEKIRAASPGGAGRNRTLNIKKLEVIEVPVPNIRQQEIFCSLLARIESAQVERKKSREAIESVIPSVLQRVFDKG